MTPMNTGLGTRLRQLVARLDRAVDDAYADLGVTYRAAFTPLTRALLADGAMSVRQIATAVGATHSAASQTVAQMRRAGLLDDAPATDGRERRVRLSALAHRQLPVIQAQWARTDAAAAALSRDLGVDLDTVADAALAALRERPFLPEPPAAADRWMSADEQTRALEAIAERIERRYVFAADATAHAARVRTRPVRDDGIATGVFAEELTALLRPLDRHYTVVWGEPPPLRPGGPAEPAETALRLRRRGRVGVLDVRAFEDADGPAGDRARARLAELNECDTAVVDLRGVPGGWPSMVELLAGPFLGPDPQPLVTFTSRTDPDDHSYSRPDPRFAALADMPLYLLVDDRTASAAESFAYVLASTGRATVVGATTAGAANPGDWFAGPGGFAVFIATGAPVDPRTGGNWEAVGVRPDVTAPADQALTRALALARTGT